MKTHIITLLLAIVTLISTPVVASPKNQPPSATKDLSQITTPSSPAPELFTHTILFYNAGDIPPAIPFLSISFQGVTEAEIKKIKIWHTEMEKKFQEKGGVLSEMDCVKKASPIIQEYAPKFMSTSSESVIINFDRIKKGLILTRKK